MVFIVPLLMGLTTSGLQSMTSGKCKYFSFWRCIDASCWLVVGMLVNVHWNIHLFLKILIFSYISKYIFGLTLLYRRTLEVCCLENSRLMLRVHKSSPLASCESQELPPPFSHGLETGCTNSIIILGAHLPITHVEATVSSAYLSHMLTDPRTLELPFMLLMSLSIVTLGYVLFRRCSICTTVPTSGWSSSTGNHSHLLRLVVYMLT